MQLEAWKAIIKKLNARSQKVTKVFKKNYSLKLEHLQQLIKKIEQEFARDTIVSLICNATLLMSSNRRFEFRSWGELVEFDRSQSEKTRSVSFEITIDTFNKETQNPERYVVQLSVQNNPASFGIRIGPLGITPIDAFEVPPAPIACTIEYSDYILGKNLLGTVEEWEKALPSHESPILDRLQRRSSFIARMITGLSTAAAVFACRVLSPSADAGSAELFMSIIYSALLVLIAFYIAREVSRQIERSIDVMQRPQNIIVTQGDINGEAARKKSNRGNTLRATVWILLVVLQAILTIFIERIVTEIQPIIN